MERTDAQPPSPDTPPDPRVQAVLAGAAATVTVLLTAAAFWLSYEHLHDSATQHGLRDPARAWAWPSTVDMFIIIGELLVLRSSLARRVDWFAIALATLGSGGSIALNVASTGAHHAPLDYVVSAVPPAAALVAFGALMRQLHAHLAATPVSGTSAQVSQVTQMSNLADPAAPSTAVIAYSDPRCSAIRPLYESGSRPGTAVMRDAIVAAGHPAPANSTIRSKIRAEVELLEPHLADYPSALTA